MYKKLIAALVPLALLAACATELDPASKGFVAMQEGDYVTAERELKKALAEDPNNPYALLNLGAVYQNTGRGIDALPLYQKVLIHGKDVVPAVESNDTGQPRSLAQIAEANIAALKAQMMAK